MIVKAFKFMLALLFSLIIVEIYFQVVEKTNLWKIFSTIKPVLGQPDYDIGYKFTPKIDAIWLNENKNRVLINSYGFNDFEIQKSDIRILVTGDSMIESIQIPLKSNFENLAEKKINKILSNKSNKIQINNLAMSGHGPLRQLITVEKYGYNLNPQIIGMFLPLSRFINDELVNDLYNPSYKFIDENNIERSYGFRNRKQIKLADNFYFKTALRFIQVSSVARLIYYSIKTDFTKLIGLSDTENIQPNSIQEDCEYIKNLNDLFFNESSKKYKIMNHFFNDLHISSKNKNIKFLLFFSGLNTNENCHFDLKSINRIENIISNLTKNMNTININLDYEIKKVLNTNYKYLSQPRKKYMLGFGKNIGEGHLNYFGHTIYSKIFMEEILKNIKNL
jgi:hypothetical protein